MSGRPDRGGFTLTEMLLVTMLMGMLGAALAVSLLVSRNSYASSDAFLGVQYEARRALDATLRELREAGQIAPIVNQPRVDFQLARGFGLPAPCPPNAVCWGTENPVFPTGWIHYVVDGVTDPTNPRLVRCVSPNQADIIPADVPGGFAACRVLANHVGAFSATFTGGSARSVTLAMGVVRTSPNLPGGTMSTLPALLRTRVRLRNA